MSLELQQLTEDKLFQFKKDMQYAFRKGAEAGMGIDEEVLPEKDINNSLSAKGSKAFMVIKDGEMVGGAIVVINDETKVNHLDFLYVKTDHQGKKIGQFIWKEIERLYPDTKIWETATPYFDMRNIHFYINCCGFHAVEFFNKFHMDPNSPEVFSDKDGFFRFQKVMNQNHP